MAFLVRVLLAVGLLAVVGAAPQLSPSQPLGDAHETDTPQEETLAIEHGFAESEGTDEGSENVHGIEEDTESVPEEAFGTQNDFEPYETTPTITEGVHSNYNPGHSFGFESHHASNSDAFDPSPSFPQHHDSVPPGPTFGYDGA